jgi:hypothetical protein
MRRALDNNYRIRGADEAAMRDLENLCNNDFKNNENYVAQMIEKHFVCCGHLLLAVAWARYGYTHPAVFGYLPQFGIALLDATAGRRQDLRILDSENVIGIYMSMLLFRL